MARVEDDMQPAQDDRLTTGQIARAAEPPARTAEPSARAGDGPSTSAQSMPAQSTSAESTSAEPTSTPAARTPLLAPEEQRDVVGQWREIQAAFVDEPRKAVSDADALVASLMQRLAQMFAAEREQLETQWSAGHEVSTEDLRQGLQRYRSFFERLLSA